MADIPAVSCSVEHLHESVPFLLFRLSPFVCFPNYLVAALCIWKNKSKMVRSVRKQYLRQIVFNFLFIFLLCDIVCPILISPIPGYYMMGLLATFRMNVALPLVIMTHAVILVALTILQLIKHQLTSLSNLRFTKKFEFVVRIIQGLFKFCYFMMLVTGLAILPALELEFELEGFRKQAYHYFNNSIVLCPNMFIADPRRWNIYIPYFISLFFGVSCCLTGIVSVTTCLLLIYESRKMVSQETLTMQRNFTIFLIYQAVVYIIFIVIPVGIISALFYADIPLPENGVYYLLMICSQGAVTNLMHIVPGVYRMLRPKKPPPPQRVQREQRDGAMWSTTGSFIIVS